MLKYITLAAFAGALAVAACEARSETSISGVVIDAEDDNRFLTRLGGALRDDLTITGLEAGSEYTLRSQLVNVTGGISEPVGEPVYTTVKANADKTTVSVTLPIPANKTDFNIDYASFVSVFVGDEAGAKTEGAKPIAQLEVGDTIERTVQVHAIQRLTVKATDATDGDDTVDPKGGTIKATAHYENLVEGYKYTLGGQLLTPSGQSTGIFSSIPLFTSETKNGDVELEFAVPADRFDGIKLVPVVGIYHQNRVTINSIGNIIWNEDAKNPVMIASDPNVTDPAKTIKIGVPFEDRN